MDKMDGDDMKIINRFCVIKKKEWNEEFDR